MGAPVPPPPPPCFCVYGLVVLDSTPALGTKQVACKGCQKNPGRRRDILSLSSLFLSLPVFISDITIRFHGIRGNVGKIMFKTVAFQQGEARKNWGWCWWCVCLREGRSGGGEQRVEIAYRAAAGPPLLITSLMGYCQGSK